VLHEGAAQLPGRALVDGPPAAGARQRHLRARHQPHDADPGADHGLLQGARVGAVPVGDGAAACAERGG